MFGVRNKVDFVVTKLSKAAAELEDDFFFIAKDFENINKRILNARKDIRLNAFVFEKHINDKAKHLQLYAT